MKIEETPCPQCGEFTLHIVKKLRAKPVGSYSLAGFNMKFSAVEWPYLECTSCGISAPAKESEESP